MIERSHENKSPRGKRGVFITRGIKMTNMESQQQGLEVGKKEDMMKFPMGFWDGFKTKKQVATWLLFWFSIIILSIGIGVGIYLGSHI